MNRDKYHNTTTTTAATTAAAAAVAAAAASAASAACFMRISLMRDIKDNDVLRHLQDKMQRNNRFNHPQRRSQMTAYKRHQVDHLPPQLAAAAAAAAAVVVVVVVAVVAGGGVAGGIKAEAAAKTKTKTADIETIK